MSKVQSAEETLKELIYTDNAKGFISFLKSVGNGHVLSHSELLKCICAHRSVNCARALLEEKSGLVVDLSVPLEDGLFPLHLAAQSLSPALTYLFISKGANPNSPCDDPHNLPLNSALIALRDNEFVSDWNPKISVFKLFYIFCLRELKEPLETVILLASKTNNLEMMALRCVKQGEVVQLTALLLLAWSKLMESCADQGIRGSPIGKLILDEYRQLENNIALVPNSSADISERIANLQTQWKVLQFLDRARDTITKFRRSTAKILKRHEVPFYVALQLKFDHDFYLEKDDLYTDDVKCLTAATALKPNKKAWLFRAINKEKSSVSVRSTLFERYSAGAVSGSHSYHTCQARNFNLVKPARSLPSSPTHMYLPFMPKLLLSVDLAPQNHLHSCGAGTVSDSRSFHTCQARNLNLFKPARSPLSRMTPTLVPFMPKLLQSVHMAPLMAMFKRSARRL